MALDARRCGGDHGASCTGRAASWVALIAEIGGAPALTRFRTLAPDTSRSILLDSLRSIDANHAWQPCGLPYPRSEGSAEPVAAERRRFGYGSVPDEPPGFWLFIEPAVRDAGCPQRRP